LDDPVDLQKDDGMLREKRIYRQLKTMADARTIIADRFGHRSLASENLPVEKSLHRLTAGPVIALESVPSYHAAAMDGIAVKAAGTFGALPEHPVILSSPENAIPVDTGDPLPEGMDAVVMIENTEPQNDTWQIREAVYPWQNVRKTGEDIVRGEIVLPARHRIRPVDQAALLAAGILSIDVIRQPRVLIVPTGDEVTLPGKAVFPLAPGLILEVNGRMLASLAFECGAIPELLPPIPDKPLSLRTTLTAAIDGGFDLVMIIAGSSTGSEDHTPTLLEEEGQLLIHGITVMPGKPTLVGAIKDVPVVGIPGYPVSAAIAFREIVKPLLFMMQGLEPAEPQKIRVTVGRKIPSKLGLEEHLRVILGKVGGKFVAMPLARGAGLITTLVRADGIIRIPQQVSGVAEGEETEAELLIPESAVDDRLLIIGSHDLTIDLIGSMLREKTSGRIAVSSANVGSLGGLLAVKKGIAHLAGSHLLDTDTGDYNRSYIHQHLAGMSVTLVTLVHRWQGFILPKGNPKRINGIGDLARPGITFVNRQGGSGTRILLDYELQKAGIDPSKIAGYRTEEFTHMNVAVAVASGSADVGLGILAAAEALSLDFVPVTRERYDLVIPTEILADEKLRLLLEIIATPEFKQKVQAMGGYEIHETGRIVPLEES
jgi:molybdenum cofactor synthesis domain-containing protein